MICFDLILCSNNKIPIKYFRSILDEITDYVIFRRNIGDAKNNRMNESPSKMENMFTDLRKSK